MGSRYLNVHCTPTDVIWTDVSCCKFFLPGTLSECRSLGVTAELLTRGSGGKTCEACGRSCWSIVVGCTLRMRRCDRKFRAVQTAAGIPDPSGAASLRSTSDRSPWARRQPRPLRLPIRPPRRLRLVRSRCPAVLSVFPQLLRHSH